MKMTSKIYAKEILSKINDDIQIKLYAKDEVIREKNLDFLGKYALSISDVEDYIHCLREKNFKAKFKTEDKNISSEYLYEFVIDAQLENGIGSLDFVSIYIKIGYIEDDGEMILVVSFHD